MCHEVMGFGVDTSGNHNFDAGIAHLQSMIDIAGDSPGHEDGSPFQYVSARRIETTTRADPRTSHCSIRAASRSP